MQHLLSRKKQPPKDNFFYLLCSLLFLLLSSAIVAQFALRSLLGQSLVMAFTVISMGIGVWSLRSNKGLFNGAIALTLICALFSSVVIFLDRANLSFLLLFFMLFFFLLTLKLATEQALFAGKITYNSIVGSICIFLLLGLIWVILYLLVNEFSENAFLGLNFHTWQENFPDLIYFSFITLTTSGFGDILAISPIARFLVYLECIVGVFYMAIVVASLIGSSLNTHKARRSL
ncbi:ion channel protein [Psychromonas sp. CNPT3]|uniref:potassium channel family protein n=1 Tax=Psychromonas sp. CNPT3 TaxID=314282 RepID=UPI00006E4284|nr:potassium channel family protein [Psychromonas sp. CNPT3]AGH82146.1 ion channel protein [Psychromonas sp. CNPT3]